MRVNVIKAMIFGATLAKTIISDVIQYQTLLHDLIAKLPNSEYADIKHW